MTALPFRTARKMRVVNSTLCSVSFGHKILIAILLSMTVLRYSRRCSAASISAALANVSL
nr:MAG TPA: hypothetical protein [Caudoviricetes sp.]